jgi:hypothetical protein
VGFGGVLCVNILEGKGIQAGERSIFSFFPLMQQKMERRMRVQSSLQKHNACALRGGLEVCQ